MDILDLLRSVKNWGFIGRIIAAVGEISLFARLQMQSLALLGYLAAFYDGDTIRILLSVSPHCSLSKM